MRKWMTGLMILAALTLSACGRADGGVVWQPNKAEPAPEGTTALPEPETQADAGYSVTRSIDQDPDADGIADSRLIITETFDAAGNLLSSTQEEDFEADGIVDSRFTTTFR